MDWRDLEETSEIQLAVLGDPIDHSLSPTMQQAVLDHLGINGKYHALKVRFNELEDCIAHLASIGFLGVNITIPHKEDSSRIGTADETVNLLSAANTLKFSDGKIEARNTDVAGFLKPISTLPPGHALVLGAGGAAAAAVYALTTAGWSVNIWNRSPARAEDLALKFNARVIDNPDPADCSLIVNATPLGLAEETPPILWDNLAKGATVYDMVYAMGRTSFLKTAKAAGCGTIDGREMLVEQGALSFEWWFNLPAPREIMREAIGL